MDIRSFFKKRQPASVQSGREKAEEERTERELQEAGRMDPLMKKTDEERSSENRCDLQLEPEGESHTFQFRHKGKTVAVACKTSKTVLDALNTNTIFKEFKEENKQKEIVIRRSKGEVPRAAVNADFPCCLIEKEELLEISFITNEGIAPTKQKTTANLSLSNRRETLVTFYIKTKGGEKVKHLMKSNALRLKFEDVCVFAFKEEKLKTALRRDGRFKNIIFKKHCALSELDSDTIHEMSNSVEHLDQKHFQVIVISNKNQPDSQEDFFPTVKTESNEAPDTDLAENVDPNQHSIKTKEEKPENGSITKPKYSSTKQFAPESIPDSKEILNLLRAQFKDLFKKLKERENLKNNSEVQKFFRVEYDKSVQSFSEVKKVKQLMTLSDSVCQIRYEGSAKGSGFLLFNRFILTNAHVIGVYNLATVQISEFTAVFGYEDLEQKEIKCVPVKDVAAYYYGKDDMDRHLDFALLELKDVDEIGDYPEMFSRYRCQPPPDRGGICIVGHPEGGIKKMDPCFIIGKENRQKAGEKHVSENRDFYHVITQQCLDEKWKIHRNTITYDSCFFHGSSGSPVFDEDCHLIGIHTGGYTYEGERGKTRSVMEYAYSMQPILDFIKAQAKLKGRRDILDLLKGNSNVPDITKFTEQQNQTDSEMKDVEKTSPD